MIRMWWHKNNGQYNFGDELGPYLVEKLSGKKVRYTNITRLPFPKTLITIGSILAVSTRNCKVWGSGIINYNDSIHGGTFYAVRGPVTQKKLRESGFKVPEAIGDPGLLLPLVYHPKVNKKFKVGIIPHIVDLEAISRAVGSNDVNIIDLGQHIEKVVNEILSCEMILSTSLHGVIVSHAYQVPALWFRASDKLFGDGSKFLDYFQSVGIEATEPVQFDYSNFSMNAVDALMRDFKTASLPNVDLNHIRHGLLNAAPFHVKKEFLSHG